MILPVAKEEHWTKGNPVYNKIPLGHNTIGNMMKEIFTTAKMFQIYTNHSIRATASKSSTMQRHRTGLFAVCQDTGMSTASWATAEICIDLTSNHSSTAVGIYLGVVIIFIPILYIILNLWVPLATRFAFLVASSSQLYLNYAWLMLYLYYILYYILRWNQIKWIELNWIESNWTELNWIELKKVLILGHVQVCPICQDFYGNDLFSPNLGLVRKFASMG